MNKTYNKLVRDNIIDIIEKSGKTCTFKVLDENEYLDSLSNKLFEELNEFQENFDIEELADLQEVILAILKAKNISEKEFDEIRLKKQKKNGAFDKKLFLIDVEEKD